LDKNIPTVGFAEVNVDTSPELKLGGIADDALPMPVTMGGGQMRTFEVDMMSQDVEATVKYVV